MHNFIWNNILSDLSSKVDSNRFETWLRPLIPVPTNDETVLSLCAPNQFIADFLVQNFKDMIISSSKKFLPSVKDLVICVKNDFSKESHYRVIEQKRSIEQMKPEFPQFSFDQQKTYPQLNKRFTLDSFVVGPGNQFARSAALAVAQAPGKTKFNPLLIYGGVGLGKTHLLQSIGNNLLSSNFSVTYVTSEEFYLNFIDAIKNNNTKKFTEKFRTSDLLLMDDVQFFSGKESTQEEFFYIFNTLYQNGKQIVLTSDLPPNLLKGLQDRLISRFQWGLCVDIQPPDLETRVAILKRKAEEDNLSISPDILYYIAENVSSNIRELEGVVIRLLAFASITKTDITIDLVKSLLKDSKKTDTVRVSIDKIIEKVSEFYKVPVNNLREKNRKKEVAHCRQVAMYISKKMTNCSLKTIGLNFGGRDHSTVVHAIQQIDDMMKDDLSLSKDIEYIISSLHC